MANNNQLDPVHIQRRSFDSEKDAMRVSMLPMEMSMELNADDGDSVLAKRQMEVVQLNNNDTVDCSKYSRIMFFTSDITFDKMTLKVLINNNIELPFTQLSPNVLLEICCPKIKFEFTLTENAILYAVFQS